MLGKLWIHKNYIFAFVGVIILLSNLFPSSSVYRYKPLIPYLNIDADELGLYLGIGCCIIQIVIWLFAFVRWIGMLRIAPRKNT